MRKLKFGNDYVAQQAAEERAKNEADARNQASPRPVSPEPESEAQKEEKGKATEKPKKKGKG